MEGEEKEEEEEEEEEEAEEEDEDEVEEEKEETDDDATKSDDGSRFGVLVGVFLAWSSAAFILLLVSSLTVTSSTLPSKNLENFRIPKTSNSQIKVSDKKRMEIC